MRHRDACLALAAALSLACLLTLPVQPVFAQSPPASPVEARASGAIEGRVIGQAGEGIPYVRVLLLREGGTQEPVAEVRSSDDGRFAFAGVAPGTWRIVSRSDDGLAEGTVGARVEPGATATVTLPLRIGLSEAVTVTDSRGARLRRETPATVGAVSRETLLEARPSHPSEVMAQIAGVWVNITGGEGHQTAIRQPLTTNPVYLYLEDGVPTRSTGFFNHNALYEINVPAADGIEVTKGPGSASYGSDAIGGVVNVVTRSSLDRSGVDVTAEGGEFGWRRALVGGNWSSGTDGVRGTLNLTHSDGWRERTAYDRQSGSVRWDRARPGSLTKTLVSLNNIDQQTAGSSALSEIDFLRVPQANLTPISLRAVQAYRASVDYQRAGARTTWNVVPYFRYDTMDLLANWSLTYDPTIYTTDNASYGLLARVQRELAPMRTSVLAGLDVDYSPGGRVEDIVRAQSTPSDLPSGRSIFTSYTLGDRIYDYDVTFWSASPYVQVEFSPSARTRVSAGLRADRMRYDYDDHLTTPETARHRRPQDGGRTFTHLSPKLGWTYQVSDRANVFASYRHAFRAPSEGQLFRQGSAVNTIDLDPVRADNVEAGTRFTLRPRVSLDVSVYQLDKRNDILSFRDPVDGATEAVNAGHTRHRGIEATLDAGLFSRASLHVAYSYAKHTYEDWVVDPLAGVDYSGFEQEMAPRHMGSASWNLSPARRIRAGMELVYLGPYWLDAANTTRYGGHTLVNLRGQYEVAPGVRLFARVLNVGNRTYAESGSYTLQRGREFAPGRPRTVFAGAEVEWRRP